MTSSWLITWEWIGDHAAVDEKVVSLVNYRKAAPFIKDLMEQLYIEKNATLSEKLRYAKDLKVNPYPARYGGKDGAEWEGEIHCGDNPWLYGRLVNNVRLEMKNGEETLEWDERTPKTSP